MEQKSVVLSEMFSFREKICVDASEVTSTFISDVVAKDPRVIVYLASMSVSTDIIETKNQLVINVQYKNKNVSLNDIRIIDSEVEMHSLLCQYIGNYKTHLILLSRSDINVETAYERFAVVNAAFYANFIGAKIKKGNSLITSFLIYEFELSYRIGRVKLSMMEDEIDSEVKLLAQKMFLPNLSEEAKIYLAHNYLATTIKYTLNSNASKLDASYLQSAYGAIIKKQCVCQGFAEAFKRLMDEAGIKCEVVCGQVVGSHQYHAWNIVQLKSGKNYHIDVTWDSNDNKAKYDYFAKDDSFFVSSRVWNRRYMPRCGGGADVLKAARNCILQNKAALLGKGVALKILDL